MELKPGIAAPSFTLINQHGQAVSIEQYRGKKLLLYFYPKAETSGCTLQATQVRDALPRFSELGIAALGISPDPPEMLKAFDQHHRLGFPLLSDRDHQAAEAYGVWRERTTPGGTSAMGILRSSFLVDEQGRIMNAWYGVKPEDTVPFALEALKAAEKV
jgi:peroxiredoxin Q/BCP